MHRVPKGGRSHGAQHDGTPGRGRRHPIRSLVFPLLPYAPRRARAYLRPQDVVGYFTDRQDGILLYNGLLLIFAAFFLLWYLGTLYGALRSAKGRGAASRPWR